MMKRVSGGWIIVLTTTSSKEEAENIARELLERKLVACVNIIDGVKSLFWWEGRIDEAREALMIIKTRVERINGIIKTIKEKHSYQVPEIIVLPILAGLPEYLQWIDKTVIMEREGNG